MINILPEGMNAGDPISKRAIWRAFRFMIRAWETLSIEGGTVQWLAGRPKIIFTGDTSGGEGEALPEGGEQYQVLQRDSGGNAVWDWVRWP